MAILLTGLEDEHLAILERATAIMASLSETTIAELDALNKVRDLLQEPRDEPAIPSCPPRRLLVELEEQTWRRAANLIRTRWNIIGTNAVGDLLLAIDRAVEVNAPNASDLLVHSGRVLRVVSDPEFRDGCDPWILGSTFEPTIPRALTERVVALLVDEGILEHSTAPLPGGSDNALLVVDHEPV